MQEAKDHLRVDFDDDDVYINSLTYMAENIIEIEIEDDLENLVDENGELPGRLKQGMLLMIGHLYNVREPVLIGVNANKIPFGFDWLISAFKNWTIS